MKPFFMILISVCLAAIGQLFLKKGAMSLDDSFGNGIFNTISSIFLNFYLVCGLALYGIGSIIWIAVLSKVDLSYAYPMVSISYVIVALLAILLFNEKIFLVHWVGMSFIVIGVMLISSV